ncbi:MAG TPA: hypothetical protein VMR98_05230, partial [Candidatus Polarisedimenticolaceae bacterium]|nr:hypothetical protein [Candidatus Polarisedimenticolaceae bacterium]
MSFKLIAAAILTVVGVPAMAVQAAPTSNLTQSISTGSLLVDILDASLNPVASPSASMSAKNFSFDCQFG